MSDASNRSVLAELQALADLRFHLIQEKNTKIADLQQQLAAAQERIAALTDENTYLRAENEKALECIHDYAEGFRKRGEHLSHTRNELKAAQERILALEHRQEHYRTMLALAASWLAIAPQASLEWIESLGYEILAALDEQAADPLPCEERIAALEEENKRAWVEANRLADQLWEEELMRDREQ